MTVALGNKVGVGVGVDVPVTLAVGVAVRLATTVDVLPTVAVMNAIATGRGAGKVGMNLGVAVKSAVGVGVTVDVFCATPSARTTVSRGPALIKSGRLMLASVLPSVCKARSSNSCSPVCSSGIIVDQVPVSFACDCR